MAKTVDTGSVLHKKSATSVLRQQSVKIANPISASPFCKIDNIPFDVPFSSTLPHSPSNRLNSRIWKFSRLEKYFKIS